MEAKVGTETGIGAPWVVIPHIHPIPQPLSEAAFVVTVKVRALLAVVAIEGASETLWAADTAEWARAGLRQLSIGIGAENDLMRGRTVEDAWLNISLDSVLPMHLDEGIWVFLRVTKSHFHLLKLIRSRADHQSHNQRLRASDGLLRTGRRTRAWRPSRHATHTVGTGLRIGL